MNGGGVSFLQCIREGHTFPSSCAWFFTNEFVLASQSHSNHSLFNTPGPYYNLCISSSFYSQIMPTPLSKATSGDLHVFVEQCYCVLSPRVIPGWAVSSSSYVTACHMPCLTMSLCTCAWLWGCSSLKWNTTALLKCIADVEICEKHLDSASWTAGQNLELWVVCVWVVCVCECVSPPTYNSSPFCNSAAFCRCKLWPRTWIRGIKMSSGNPKE